MQDRSNLCVVDTEGLSGLLHLKGLWLYEEGPSWISWLILYEQLTLWDEIRSKYMSKIVNME